MSAIVAGTPRKTASPPRRRILDTAAALFYAEGIRAVGIDRIITEAGVAKATFYHHFPTKDLLVVAYLEEMSLQQRAAAQALGANALTAGERLLRVFDVLGEIACGPGFRGCAFVNAAAEYPDPEHPVRRTVAGHRAWFRGLMEELLTEMGRPDAAVTAGILVLLRDGMVAGAALDDAAEARSRTRVAITRVLAAPAEAAAS
ncbi:TetR/AcrR family transcriptional regulator [Microbispora sp. RL4-1S]|uniref:TetR/AcrR family transcriptional regulator n=1 Tax=Microbispora oryzae TaxID=2806554 RepID=A0A941AK15_9ACTN|nr:TetR/AcrR family transcriptional regulator [Microbispora oryzae]MBP2706990.1 TetR/AcrR family transcriptional regulator [Microbispora oryzae]